jgi:hypothetical protein
MDKRKLIFVTIIPFFLPVCEIFYWRIVTALFIMTYMFVKKCNFVSFFER